jgi:type IV secretory pathway VirB10-like protein
MRWMRSTGPGTAAEQGAESHGRRLVRSIALGCLLAGVLLGGLPAAASAAAPEMRGEWELVVTTPSGPAQGSPVRGGAMITNEANAQGEFATNNVLFSGAIHGMLSGKLEGSKASIVIKTEPYPPYPSAEFASTTLTVEANGGSLSMSGSGTFTPDTSKPGTTEPGTLAATRLKTYKEIEEREAREKKEREEREAREKKEREEREAREKKEREEREARGNVRGEWELTLSSGAGSVKGMALIANAANTKNEFASNGALFEGVVPGSFSGTLEGGKASVKITTQAYGSFPASEFTSTTITVTSTTNPMSMSGSGTGTFGPATLTATRIKTYKQVEEQLAKEAKEAKEAREAQEAKEMREAREAKEKQEREASEKLAREAVLKTAPPTAIVPSIIRLFSAAPAGSTFSATSSGAVSLELSNPNGFPVQGHLMLVTTGAGKAASAKSKKKAISLGTASFTIAANGHEVVKIKLSKGNDAMLVRRKKLHATLTVSTIAAGDSPVVKAYAVTLMVSGSHSHRH